MRTFIFVKNEKDANGRMHRIIKGIKSGGFFPSTAIATGGQFEHCDCIEITDCCHIDLGVFKV